jgi:phosphoribosylanthranilate isomerase
MERRVRVKICGVTTVADAQLAVDLSAWSVGMIFHVDSPRRCSAEQASRIAAAVRRRTKLCGVYVNAPLEQIERDCEQLGLSMIQLNGDEGPAFCAEAKRRTGALVVKAAQVADAGDVRALERYHVDYHLLDTRPRDAARAGLRGGTGETFDWGLAAARRSRVPLILSGGLHAGNVGAAIAATHPHAIDSASGTEESPGHKDPRRMRALFAAVEAAPAQQHEIGSPA